MVVVEAEQKDCTDQTSVQPWLNQEQALRVEGEEEGTEVGEGRSCKRLGGCCSLTWRIGLEEHLEAETLSGSGSADEPACCT